MAEILEWIGNNLWSIPTGYIAFISVWSIIITCYDKIASKKLPKHRIKEMTLFALAALGGSVAMYFTMLTIRHKTLHKRFMIGIPLIILLQVVSLYLLIHFGIIKI